MIVATDTFIRLNGRRVFIVGNDREAGISPEGLHTVLSAPIEEEEPQAEKQ